MEEKIERGSKFGFLVLTGILSCCHFGCVTKTCDTCWIINHNVIIWILQQFDQKARMIVQCCIQNGFTCDWWLWCYFIRFHKTPKKLNHITFHLELPESNWCLDNVCISRVNVCQMMTGGVDLMFYEAEVEDKMPKMSLRVIVSVNITGKPYLLFHLQIHEESPRKILQKR